MDDQEFDQAIDKYNNRFFETIVAQERKINFNHGHRFSRWNRRCLCGMFDKEYLITKNDPNVLACPNMNEHFEFRQGVPVLRLSHRAEHRQLMGCVLKGLANLKREMWWE